MGFFLGLILPFIWIFYFFHKDKHPEPASWLFLTFVLGIFSAFLSFFTEGILAYHYPYRDWIYFLFAAFVEEFFKFLVIWILIFPQKVFDEPIDAMIYMMFSALGFAVLENVMVLLSPQAQGKTLFISFYRFLGANFLHILASALIGYGFGLMSITRRIFPFLLSFLSAVFLHFLFNFVILSTNLGFLYVLPLLWSVFLVVLSELNYLILINERRN